MEKEKFKELLGKIETYDDSITFYQELKDNICFAHKINPAIMGVKVAGSLGNAQELEMSYAIFEKNVVFPMRKQLEYMYDELLQIAGVEGQFKILDFKIVENQIVEAPNTNLP